MVSVNRKGNKMTDEKLVQLGLNDKDSLKMILSGYVEKQNILKDILWCTVYPLDTELEELDHYPSIAIFESDFK